MRPSGRTRRLFTPPFSRVAAALILASAIGCGGDSDGGATARQTATWTAIGPDGGQIRTLAVDPGNRAGLYAGTVGGGVFRSRDRGESWTSLGLTDLDVFAIVVDPSDPETIYVAGVQGFPGPSLRGVFKSTDAGRTWTRSDTGLVGGEPTPQPADVFALAIDPETPTTLYAGAAFGGVFRSVDAGTTWQPHGLTHAQVIVALAIDPERPTVLYAASRFEGVFKSVDGGATWQSASSGITSAEFPGLEVLALNTILVDPRSPTTLYVGTGQGGVYRSLDGAATWEATAPTGFPDVRALTLDRRSETLLAGAWTPFCDGPGCEGGIFASTDRGDSWQPASIGLADRNVNALVADPHAPSTVYAGTDSGGVFRSDDSGDRWTDAMRGLTGREISALVVDSFAAATVYALASGTPFRSEDGGTTWQQIDAGLETAWAYAIVSVGDTVWLGAAERFNGGTSAGLYVSRDGGTSWRRVDGIGRPVSAVAVDPQHPDVLYAGTWPITIGDDLPLGGEIVKTTDGGAHWTTVLTFTDPDELALVFALDPVAPETVYVATYVAGILKSVDGGASWNVRSAGLDSGCCAPAAASLAIDPTRPDTLYAGTHRGVFKSTDGATSWTATGLENLQTFLQVTGLVIDPVADVVYASVAGDSFGSTEPIGKGVFASADAGTSWTPVGDDLPARGVDALALDPSSRRLYAGTVGASVYALTAR